MILNTIEWENLKDIEVQKLIELGYDVDGVYGVCWFISKETKSFKKELKNLLFDLKNMKTKII